jgi:amidophosphoribosyltransferase
MIDDSIVRGTTVVQIIRLLREAGANEVHVLSASPKFISPCHYGTDIPTRDVLFAYNYTTAEMRNIIGADSLGFLRLESLCAVAPDSTCRFCDACFTENYPVLQEKKRSPQQSQE